MIYHDRITLKLGGGRDDDGRPLPTRDAVYRAEVWPLSAEDYMSYGQPGTSVLYRAVLPPLRAGDTINTSTQADWNGLQYQVVGPPMVNTVNGRVRHVELLLKRATF